MSSSCCQRSAPLSARLRAAIETRLQSLSRDAADFRFDLTALCSTDGQIIASAAPPRVAADQAAAAAAPTTAAPIVLVAETDAAIADQLASLSQTIPSLRVAAARFAATLQVQEVPALHVKGATSVFSLYTVSPEHQLAVFATPESDVEHFDTGLIDAALEQRLEDLTLFLSGLTVR
mmetsp:Transcript_14430/g.46148  ORF Transcript_14430/g.46148 Transcript_14430/m.46148 type:complete len:177 (+) Transcript_14430:59-589(+)